MSVFECVIASYLIFSANGLREKKKHSSVEEVYCCNEEHSANGELYKVESFVSVPTDWLTVTAEFSSHYRTWYPVTIISCRLAAVERHLVHFFLYHL